MLSLVLLFLAGVNVTAGTYCAGGPTSYQDSNLGAVHFDNISDTSDCPGQTGVQDHTNMKTAVIPGSSYTLLYDVTTCGQAYSRSSAVWIDWNHNERFEANEQVGATHSTFSSAPSETVHVTFTVPDDATIATTRMRVMVQESATNLDPCAVYTYGGAKDFSIEILPRQDGLLVLCSDAACHNTATKVGGSNATWGSDISKWSSSPLQFNFKSGTSAVTWSISEGDSYSLYIDEDGTKFKLAKSSQDQAGFVWQVTAQHTTWGVCTSVEAVFSDLQILTEDHVAVQSFFLLNV